MAGFTISEIINRSSECVFDLLTDWDKTPEYITTLKELLKVTDGPKGVGTHFSEIRTLGNLKYTADMWISQYQKPERYSLTSKLQGFLITYHYVLIPMGESTQIDMICEVLATGIRKAMIPFVVFFVWIFDGRHLAKLKKIIENTPG